VPFLYSARFRHPLPLSATHKMKKASKKRLFSTVAEEGFEPPTRGL